MANDLWIRTEQWALGILLATLAACSSVPPYKAPQVEVPQQFKEAQPAQSTSTQSQAAQMFQLADPKARIPQTWWTVFKDPVLNDLQIRAEQGNQNIASSMAAVKLASAATASANASLWPSVNLSGGANKSNVQSATNPKGTTFTVQSSVSSWELDLWDRLGASAQANAFKEEASRADLASARLSLQASVAQTYFSIRAAEVLNAALQDIAKANEKFLTLTQNQYQGGIASRAAVASAQSQLQSTLAQVVEARLTRATLEHAMASLLGLAPAAFTLAPTAQLPAVPVVPLQVPSQLLEQRPDIASAERKVAAANSAVGAADAAFFPSLTLSGNYGFRNAGLAGLLDLPNRIWSLGPSLGYALFDGGARKAASASARASYEQTVAAYRQTVIGALQEVEDNLATAYALQNEEAIDQAALNAAHTATEVNTNQYSAGLVSYLNVITAQNTELSLRNNLINVQSRRLTALAILLKNLGGSWDGAKPKQP